MGWALSWAALKDGSVQTVCSALGLRATGKREGIAESKIAGTSLPAGWYVVVFHRTEIKDKTLERLSQAGEVVGCFVEDHVMFSSASAWRNGKRLWHVTHNGGEDHVLHLETSGNLSADFESIRKEVFAKQEKEAAEPDDLKVDHVYDLPAQLAKKLTGFRHDEDVPGLADDAFEVLDPVKGSGWNPLKRLFGGDDI